MNIALTDPMMREKYNCCPEKTHYYMLNVITTVCLTQIYAETFLRFSVFQREIILNQTPYA